MPTHDDGLTYHLPCGCWLRYQYHAMRVLARCGRHATLTLEDLLRLPEEAPCATLSPRS